MWSVELSTSKNRRFGETGFDEQWVAEVRHPGTNSRSRTLTRELTYSMFGCWRKLADFADLEQKGPAPDGV